MKNEQYNRRAFLTKSAKLMGVAGVLLAGGSLISCEESMYKSYVVDKSKCTSCNRCNYVCRYGAVSLVQVYNTEGTEIISSSAYVDQKLCYKCGKCIDVCPEKAISFI